VLANAVRNGWAYAVIYCGHLTEATATFSEEDLAKEDRAGWYARQVMGSSNFEASRIVHLLSGHLGFQIEHHLFPNIPAWRYPEMAPRVREICERHGLPYSTKPLAAQFTSAMRRLVRHALPTRAKARRGEARDRPSAPAPQPRAWAVASLAARRASGGAGRTPRGG
jgi:linoleoyl-CoA desaturase